ncbi:hypothetical protein KIN20_018969 [Parelaphostrongylus tenuis]|uniref:Uncharacterized protein n=1 Tax=Parelaphostrongylus tenuis TaxID=148309 RepID=A0AAD5MNR8_PARTN|nr:hypothetical protein KIN20_018969 [Parelaphostrongylus tenuis]
MRRAPVVMIKFSATMSDDRGTKKQMENVLGWGKFMKTVPQASNQRTLDDGSIREAAIESSLLKPVRRSERGLSLRSKSVALKS